MLLFFINTLGIALIATIVWWFWLYQPKQKTLAGSKLEVLVNNGFYQPAHIVVPAQKAFTLQFIRRDPSPCAEQVIFPELEISEHLTLNQSQDIRFTGLKPGRYAFHCQMQMYRGELEVA